MTAKTTLTSWLNNAPTPVCVPVSMAFDEKAPLSLRHDALWFSVYQLLRCTGLVLLSETLQHPNPSCLNLKVYGSVTRALAQIRQPCFSDWITLLWTLIANRKSLGLNFLSEEEATILESCKSHKVSLRGFEKQIGEQPFLEIFRLLRNLIAHGGIQSEGVCLKDLEVFLPHLAELVKGPFAFLEGWNILALQGSWKNELNRIWRLNGRVPLEEELEVSSKEHSNLSAAFSETPVVVRNGRSGRLLNIYPLFLYREEPELPRGMLDGFFRKGSRQILYYLDQDRRQIFDSLDIKTPFLDWRHAHDCLSDLMEHWKLTWEYDRKTMTPWKLRDPMEYHTDLLIEGLRGTKYIPETYCERKGVDEFLVNFCFLSPIDSRYPWRAVLLEGEMGRGKSALMAHIAANRKTRQEWHLSGEEEPLFLFVRCDGVGLKAEIQGEDILFRNIAPCLGIKVGSKGYSGFPEFLNHLNIEFSRLEKPARFILFVDGINEAPYPEPLLIDLVRCIQQGRNYPWLRVVFSVRTSYLLTLKGKRAIHGGHETNPLFEIYDLLFPCPWKERNKEYWELPPLRIEESLKIFDNYQSSDFLPACLDSFESLKKYWETEEGLLRTPLYIHFWMEAFHGRRSASVSGMEELFSYWLEEKFRKNDGLWDNLRPILMWLFEKGQAAFDEEGALSFQGLMGTKHSAELRRTLFSPIEVVLSEGLMVRPSRGELKVQFPFEALAAVCFARYMDEQLCSESTVIQWLDSIYSREKPPESIFSLAVSLYLETLFSRQDYNLMARFLDSEFVRENSVFPWILREMSKQSEVDEWKDGFVEFIEACAPDTQMWAAYMISPNWTRTIMERFIVSPKQIPLNNWAVEWFRTNLDERIPETLNELAISLKSYGDVCYALGGEENLREALRFYEESLMIQKKLKSKATPSASRNISVYLNKCGNVLYSLGGEENLKRALNFYDESRKIFKELKNSAIPKTLSDVATSLISCGRVLQLLGGELNLREALKLYEESLKIFEEIQSETPERLRNISVSLDNCGNVLFALGGEENLRKALRLYKKSLTIRREIRNPTVPSTLEDLSQALDHCGHVHYALGGEQNLREALRLYEKSLRIRKELKNPAITWTLENFSLSLNNCGHVIRALGGERNLLEASKRYKESLRIREKLKTSRIPKTMQDWSVSLTNCGHVYYALGGEQNLREALRLYEKSLKIRKELKTSGNHYMLRDYFVSLNNYGDVLIDLGGERDLLEALKCFKEALKVAQELENQTIPETQLDLSMCLSRCGIVLFELGGKKNLLESLKYFRESLRIGEIIKNLDIAKYLHNYSICLNNCGRALYALGGKENLLEALKLYEKSLRVREKLKTSGIPKTLRDFALSLNNCANVLASLGGEVNLRKALELYLDCRKIFEELNNPSIPETLKDLSNVICRIAEVTLILRNESNPSRASRLFEESLKLNEEVYLKSRTAENLADIIDNAWRVSRLCEQGRSNEIKHIIVDRILEYQHLCGSLPDKYKDMLQMIKKETGTLQ